MPREKVDGKTLSRWIAQLVRENPRQTSANLTSTLKLMGFQTDSKTVSTLLGQKRRRNPEIPKLVKGRKILNAVELQEHRLSSASSRLDSGSSHARRLFFADPDATDKEILGRLPEGKKLSLFTISGVRQSMVQEGILEKRKHKSEPLQLTSVQQELLEKHRKDFDRISSDVASGLPMHLREDFKADAVIPFLRALQKYNPEKTSFKNYLLATLLQYKKRFLTNLMVQQTGYSIGRIRLALRADLLAKEACAGGMSREQAFEKGARQAISEYAASYGIKNTNITPNLVRECWSAMQSVRSAISYDELREEGGCLGFAGKPKKRRITNYRKR